MIIKETTVFTKKILALLPDEDYRLLQEELVNNPEIGKLIKNSGGIRKFRWGLGHKGKSGGLRVIYYWLLSKDQIYMLYAYPKSEQENLTDEQLFILKKVVEEELYHE
jgi:hypothetical protein